MGSARLFVTKYANSLNRFKLYVLLVWFVLFAFSVWKVCDL